MRRFYLIGFIVLLAFDTLAQISFKYTAMAALPVSADLGWLARIFSQPWVYFAILSYLGAFFSWMTLLKHAPIGPAFAASHMEVLTVMLIAVPLFGDQLKQTHIIGAALILVGIVCLAFSEGDEEPKPGTTKAHG